MCGYSLIRFPTVLIRHDCNLMQIISWYMEKNDIYMDNNPHFEIVCDVFLYSLFLLVSFACINLKKKL